MQYTDLALLIPVWAEKCSSLLVVEHPADGKTQRIHCHFLIETELADDEPFRTSGKKTLGEFFKRGNYWIATRVMKGEHQGKLIERSPTSIYMIKGKHSVKYSKNFSNQELETSRQSWVETVKSDDSGVKSSEVSIKKVYDIVKVTLDKKLYDTDEDGIELFRAETILDQCRSEAFKLLYFQNHRVAPHASHYKIIAASAFMRLMEDQNKLHMAIAELKNLWY